MMGCKLLIEVPVNGGRNYNGPKVNSLPTTLVTVWIAFGYMLENPSIRPVLVLDFGRGQ